MRLCLAVLGLWLSAALPVWAQDWAGDWVWSVEGKPAMVLRLDASGRGEITRPLHMTLDANAGYWRMFDAGAELARLAVTSDDATDGVLALNVFDPQAGETVRYSLKRTGPDDGDLTLPDVPEAPAFALSRAATPTTVDTDWVPGRAYGKPPIFPNNADLAKLFADDQAARQGDIRSALGLERQDAERRVVVRRMLDGGQVRSAADHYHAAFIFQHGRDPDDYLLAHALAVAAVARGRDDAVWISAATLDRFLQSIERPQIYGTQFQMPAVGSVTQGDYDRALLPDSLRTVSGVPTLAAQADKVRAYSHKD